MDQTLSKQSLQYFKLISACSMQWVDNYMYIIFKSENRLRRVFYLYVLCRSSVGGWTEPIHILFQQLIYLGKFRIFATIFFAPAHDKVVCIIRFKIDEDIPKFEYFPWENA